MASYLNQPDSGGNCCDCPTRESPCDPCGCFSCFDNPPPFPLLFTFSGIIPSCGCVDFSPIFSGVSRIITAYSIDGVIMPTCSIVGAISVWSGVNEDLTITFDSYSALDCDDPDNLLDTNTNTVFVNAWCDGSDLQVALFANQIMLFYGVIPGFTVDTPYPNDLVCGQFFADNTVPPGGATGALVGMAEAGTVTLSYVV